MSELTDRIIAQYYESSKIRAIVNDIDVLIKENINDPLDDLKVQMGVKAEGYWLELLGKRFKFPRPLLTDPDSASFFGLVEDGVSDTNKGTFGAAPFISDGDGLITGRVVASNEMYSALLGIVISSMRTDGSISSIAKIVNSFFDGSYVIDNQDMSFIVGAHIHSQIVASSVTVEGSETDADGTISRGDDVNGSSAFFTDGGNPSVQYSDFGKSHLWNIFTSGGETFTHPTATSYFPPYDGWDIGNFGSPAPFVTVNHTSEGNDINVLRDNIHLIPKPAGVSLSLIEFSYFGFDNNEAGFDNGIFV